LVSSKLFTTRRFWKETSCTKMNIFGTKCLKQANTVGNNLFEQTTRFCIFLELFYSEHQSFCRESVPKKIYDCKKTSSSLTKIVYCNEYFWYKKFKVVKHVISELVLQSTSIILVLELFKNHRILQSILLQWQYFPIRLLLLNQKKDEILW